jgi:60 kDa SS-A/Ro ribonucleoprotein
MARLNLLNLARGLRTHEGAPARHVSTELQLRRSVLACLLWESQFYEDGVEIAGRIAELAPKVEAERVAALAVEAREQMKLRQVPLLLVREMARHKTHRGLVAETLERVIQRADELCEFVAIYWKDGRVPLSGQVKKGLAAAFPKFDEYQLAKYDRGGPIKLRDVLFLCHAKPRDDAQAGVWKKLIWGRLAVPNTWEVALSAAGAGDGASKTEAWTRLVAENKLGALALLRNLRNLREAGVDEKLVLAAIEAMNTQRVLPFRFLAAARHAPQWEPALEAAMLRCVASQPKLAGKTVLVIDVSGSMRGLLSKQSELNRIDTAAGLAILARELCDEVVIYATAGNDHTRVHKTEQVPARSGFALADAIRQKADGLGGGGIFLVQAMEYIVKREHAADRAIVFTDEQDCDLKLNPAQANAFGKSNYLVNVASYKNGIGYGKWTHIDGWSESVVEYVRTLESSGLGC